VGSYWPYATILFDYIRRAMPYQSPGILSNDEIYALSAYILYINNIIDEKEVITQKTIVDVEMPNSKNFIWAYPKKD
jgi:cytochrome c